MSVGVFVLHGKSIEVAGLSSRRVKFLLRRFLYVNHLSGLWCSRYRGSSIKCQEAMMGESARFSHRLGSGILCMVSSRLIPQDG